MERLDPTDSQIKADVSETSTQVAFGTAGNEDQPDIVAGSGMKFLGANQDVATIDLN